MAEPITHEEFRRLLDAYLGAREYERWVRTNGTMHEYAAAVTASDNARRALEQAVFG